MSTELPIACSLSPGDYRARIEDLASLARRALGASERTAAGARLTFAGDEELERELRAAASAEAECCPFLTLRIERAGKALVLDVSGPDAARPIIDELCGSPPHPLPPPPA